MNRRLRLALVPAAALALVALGVAPKEPRFAFHTSPASALAFRDVSGDPEQIPILDQNGQGLCAIDFDGDGLLDLYLVNGSTLAKTAKADQPGSALFRNNGDGTFTDVTKLAGVPGPRWGTGCAVADFDGDGREDLFVTGWGGNKLYRNRGDGTFEDVTESAGVRDGRWCSSAAWADLDGDGRLDLVVSRYVRFDPGNIPTTEGGRPCTYRGVETGCPPDDYPGETMAAYRNRGNGRFEDVSASAGLERARPSRGFGVAALPLFDDSSLPDIYIGCDVAENLLFHNLGGFRFDESAAERGAAVNFEGKHESGMGLAVGDLSESGRPDFFLTNFAGEKNTLYRNRGDGFSDVTIGTGLEAHREELGWGDSIADFDNDGHEDIVVANGQIYPQVEKLRDPKDSYAQPIRLFAGDGRGRFEEISVPSLSRRESRRGLIAADLNNDGRLDLVTQTHNGSPEIFWNESGRTNHWIRFTLRGRTEPEAAGARVTVRFAGRTRTAWKLPNQGYQSSQDPRVHFGLAEAAEVDGVEIRWPDGTIQKIRALPADADYVVKEDRAPVRLKLRSFAAPPLPRAGSTPAGPRAAGP
jgi:hypothetical protein